MEGAVWRGAYVKVGGEASVSIMICRDRPSGVNRKGRRSKGVGGVGSIKLAALVLVAKGPHGDARVRAIPLDHISHRDRICPAHVLCAVVTVLVPAQHAKGIEERVEMWGVWVVRLAPHVAADGPRSLHSEQIDALRDGDAETSNGVLCSRERVDRWSLRGSAAGQTGL